MKKMLCCEILAAGAILSAAGDPELSGGKSGASFVTAFPPEIRTVAVISPASQPNKKSIERAMAAMRRAGIKVKPGKWIYDRSHTAGKNGASLPRRKEDFMAAWQDPEVDLIICTRGGTGAQELIKVLDWELLKKTPKKLIGFSNITALTAAMLKKQAGHPYAGPNLGRLAGSTPEARESFRLAMAGKPQKPFPLQTFRGGDCEGGIYAGHLILLATVEKMEEFRVDPAGRIVFIECVGRTPEQLEEAWNLLLARGFFKQVKAVIFGHFTNIKPPEAVDGLLKKFAGTVTCPVYSGFAYGHAPDIHTLDFQARARIRNGVLTIGK